MNPLNHSTNDINVFSPQHSQLPIFKAYKPKAIAQNITFLIWWWNVYPCQLIFMNQILIEPGTVEGLLRSTRCKVRVNLWSPIPRVLSIMPKIPEISVGIQMERSVSVSSNGNIQDHLWRWSTYFGWNIPIEIRRSIFDKPVLCPN